MGFSKTTQAHRGKGIGSSEIAAVIGISPFATPHDVWRRKLPEDHPDHEGDSEPTAPMERGLFLEDGIMRWYEHRAGVKVEKARRRVHPKYPYVRDSADGLVIKDGERIGCIEVKTTDPALAHLWGRPEDGAESVPQYYYVQGIWHCGVWGFPWCDYPVFAGRDLNVYRVPADEEMFLALVKEAERFWIYNVEANMAPPITGGKHTGDWLQGRFKQRSGKLIDATEEATVAVMRLGEVRAQLKEITKEESALKQQLQAAIGEDDGIKGEWGRVTWKAPKPTKKVAWNMVAQELGATEELIEKHTTTIHNSRRFLATFKGV